MHSRVACTACNGLRTSHSPQGAHLVSWCVTNVETGLQVSLRLQGESLGYRVLQSSTAGMGRGSGWDWAGGRSCRRRRRRLNGQRLFTAQRDCGHAGNQGAGKNHGALVNTDPCPGGDAGSSPVAGPIRIDKFKIRLDQPSHVCGQPLAEVFLVEK